MFKLLTRRTVAVVILASAFIVSVSARQTPAPAAAPAPSGAELLAEMKGLRADLRQLLDASIRAQLLVARLQLQEQRITSLARQLTDVQQQLQNNERARGALEPQLKMFETMHAQSP